MLFNYTNKYQFRTRLNIDNKILETVEETKLLGTIITNDLKWDKNTDKIVKRSYARLELLRKLSAFQPPKNEMKQVYISFIRSLLEQSSNVWHSSLTKQNENDLERVQKVALKIILKNNYISYENALNVLELETLKDRRERLMLTFAQKCLKNPKMKHLFPPSTSTHPMEIRSHEHFQVLYANTERFKNSSIIYMQNLLNNEIKRRKEKDQKWNI